MGAVQSMVVCPRRQPPRMFPDSHVLAARDVPRIVHIVNGRQYTSPPYGERVHYPRGAIIVNEGMQGWFQCFWCWKWEVNMFVPNPVAGPLCEQCMDRFLDGDGPPWSPNNLQRCEEWLRRMVLPGLPRETMIPVLASFLADPFVP